MKTLILGDIHGRLCWIDIIQKEHPDLTVFLGDYVSTHDGISAEQQLSNLEHILDYKAEHPDNVILLRGNHDCQMLGYYWARCSGWDPEVAKGMESMKDRFIRLTQWVYQIPNTNIVCSHAGIGEEFEERCANHLARTPGSIYYENCKFIDQNIFLNAINTIEPCELFGFTPCKMSDYSGESKSQPCTWIRPYTLLQYGVKDIIHVVGHTPTKHICNLKEECLKTRDKYNIEEGEEIVNNYCNVWCCDNLANREYLVIEDGEFKPCKL